MAIITVCGTGVYGLSMIAVAGQFSDFANRVLSYGTWCSTGIYGALYPIACIWRNPMLRKGMKAAVRSLVTCQKQQSNAVYAMGAESVVDHQQDAARSMQILEQIWTTGRQASMPENVELTERL